MKSFYLTYFTILLNFISLNLQANENFWSEEVWKQNNITIRAGKRFGKTKEASLPLASYLQVKINSKAHTNSEIIKEYLEGIYQIPFQMTSNGKKIILTSQLQLDGKFIKVIHINNRNNQSLRVYLVREGYLPFLKKEIKWNKKFSSISPPQFIEWLIPKAQASTNKQLKRVIKSSKSNDNIQDLQMNGDDQKKNYLKFLSNTLYLSHLYDRSLHSIDDINNFLKKNSTEPSWKKSAEAIKKVLEEQKKLALAEFTLNEVIQKHPIYQKYLQQNPNLNAEDFLRVIENDSLKKEQEIVIRPCRYHDGKATVKDLSLVKKLKKAISEDFSIFSNEKEYCSYVKKLNKQFIETEIALTKMKEKLLLDFEKELGIKSNGKIAGIKESRKKIGQLFHTTGCTNSISSAIKCQQDKENLQKSIELFYQQFPDDNHNNFAKVCNDDKSKEEEGPRLSQEKKKTRKKNDDKRVTFERRVCQSDDQLNAIDDTEFLDLNTRLAKCIKRENRGDFNGESSNQIVVDSFTKPYWDPVITTNLYNAAAGSFPIVVNFMAGAGRKYHHIYMKKRPKGQDEIDAKLDELTENFEDLDESQQKMIESLREDIQGMNQKHDELIEEKSKSTLTKFKEKLKNSLSATAFPYKAEDALKLSNDEIYMYDAYKSLVVGPSLTGSYIFGEGIITQAHVGGGFASASLFLNHPHSIAVRKAKKDSRGKQSNRVQVKVNLLDENGFSLSLGGSSINNPIVGNIVVDSSIGFTGEAVRSMASLNLSPLRLDWVKKNREAFNLVFEFDLDHDKAREAYEDAVQGNFKQAEELAKQYENMGREAPVLRIFKETIQEETNYHAKNFVIPLIASKNNQCTEVDSLNEIVRRVNQVENKKDLYRNIHSFNSSTSCLTRKQGALYSAITGGKKETATEYHIDCVQRNPNNGTSPSFSLKKERDEMECRLTSLGYIKDQNLKISELEDVAEKLSLISDNESFKKWKKKAKELKTDKDKTNDNLGAFEASFTLQLNHEQIVDFLDTPDEEKKKIIEKAFPKLFDRYRDLISKNRPSPYSNGIQALLDSGKRKKEDISFDEVFSYMKVDRFINKPFALLFGAVTDCKECHQAQAVYNLYTRWQKLSKSSKDQKTKEEFVDLMKDFKEMLNNNLFTYEYSKALKLSAKSSEKESRDPFRYQIQVKNKTLASGKKPLVIQSLGQDLDGKEKLQKISFDYKSEETNSYDPAEGVAISSISTQKPLEFDAKTLDRLIKGEEEVQSIECDCLYKKENQDSFKSLGTVYVHDTVIPSKGKEASNLSRSRLLSICKDASERLPSKDKYEKQFNIDYISVPEASCRMSTLSMTEGYGENLKKLYEEYKENLLKNKDLVCSSGDKFIFSDADDWLRLSLSAVVGGFGWRWRGGGGPAKILSSSTFSRLAFGVGSQVLVSAISSDEPKTFIDGVKASALIYPGLLNGWGEFFDVGTGKGPGQKGTLSDVIGGTVVGSQLTSYQNGFLRSEGIEHNQNGSGPMFGLVYLTGLQLAKHDGGKLDFHLEHHPLIHKLELNLFTEISEFMHGGILAYNLSKSLLNSQKRAKFKNICGDYNKKEVEDSTQVPSR